MNEQQKQKKQQYPPPEFWRAVLTMRNHLVRNCRDAWKHELFQLEYEENSLWLAILITGDYLDGAIEGGLLSDD